MAELYLTVLVPMDAEQLWEQARLMYRKEPLCGYAQAEQRAFDHNDAVSGSARPLEYATIVSLAEWQLYHSERPWEIHHGH